MKYFTAWFCIDCSNELTNDEVMYSHGRCPKCGYKDKNSSTIVETKEKGYKLVKVDSGHWWKPNKYKREYL